MKERKTRKPIVLNSECWYGIANTMIALSVAMCAAADFGVSMIAAPAYILSLRFSLLSFGQCEYIVQGVLFLAFCLIIRKFRPIYLISFFTSFTYGLLLDLFRAVIPLLNPQVTAPGSMGFSVRILLFVGGMLMCAMGVAVFFRMYLCPQVYDFVVKGIAIHFGWKIDKFKICYDCGSLVLSLLLTLLFFHGFKGIGVGTLVLTLLNGSLIGLFGRMLDRWFVFKPAFPKLADKFKL